MAPSDSIKVVDMDLMGGELNQRISGYIEVQ